MGPDHSSLVMYPSDFHCNFFPCLALVCMLWYQKNRVRSSGRAASSEVLTGLVSQHSSVSPLLKMLTMSLAERMKCSGHRLF